MSAVYALIGNPNCGKTTLFNALTGARQQIGNWPGVTVEKKEGTFRADGETVTVTDLPGLYSLSPYSAEERVTRDLLLQEPPDLILNIADATHLERSLYLTLQLAELGYPMVLALNMTDRLAPAGLQLDIQRLEHRLGIPVVPIAAGRRRGIAALTERARRQRQHCAAARSPLEEQEQAAEAASLFPGQRELQQALLLRRQRYPAACRCSPKEDTWYSSPLLSVLLELEELLEPHCRERHVPLRFAAVRMLDGDEPLQAQLGLSGGERERIDRIAAQVSSASLPRDMRIADEKYRWIEQLCRECLTRRHPPEHRSLSDRIDAVVTHRLWAFPLLFAVLGGIFYLTFGPPGRELSARFEQAAEAGRELLRTGLQQCGAAAWLVRLICDGILSASPGTDVNGPIALIRSGVKLDSTPFASVQLNMKFHPSAIRGDEGSKNFVEFIRSYFRMGGYHVQFNIVDSKMLRDAQDKPQNYRDLMVRVAGFSAYWNELGKPIQDEVIARTEYESL